MLCANLSHSSASKSSPTCLAVDSASSVRQASCENSVREKPTIRVSFGSRFLRNSWYSAGISLRCVRSPEAPKMTKVCGMLRMKSECRRRYVSNRADFLLAHSHFALPKSSSP